MRTAFEGRVSAGESLTFRSSSSTDFAAQEFWISRTVSISISAPRPCVSSLTSMSGERGWQMQGFTEDDIAGTLTGERTCSARIMKKR